MASEKEARGCKEAYKVNSGLLDEGRVPDLPLHLQSEDLSSRHHDSVVSVHQGEKKVETSQKKGLKAAGQSSSAVNLHMETSSSPRHSPCPRRRETHRAAQNPSSCCRRRFICSSVIGCSIYGSARRTVKCFVGKTLRAFDQAAFRATGRRLTADDSRWTLRTRWTR